MSPAAGPRRLRVAFVGAGWIVPRHLAALDRLDRTDIVGIVSRTTERAAATSAGREIADVHRRSIGSWTRRDPTPCTPASRPTSRRRCARSLIGRGIPFLVEKPLAARDGDAPPRIADAIERAGLVVAVGYHWRGLDVLPEVRRRLADRPPELVLARWIDGTPGPDWWGRVDQGGGQVVEQATHLYDLARHLVGEAVVVGAASTAVPPAPADRVIDVVGSTSAVLRFASGAVGSFVNTRRSEPPVIELEIVAQDLRMTVRLMTERQELAWELVVVTPDGVRRTPNGRDPYEVQAEAFLDAVETGDPSRVLATYRDALATDRLTGSVVAAAGVAG